MSVTIGGGRRITLEDVVKVSVLKQKIILDPASLQAIDQKFAANKKPSPIATVSEVINSSSNNLVSVEVVRAGLFNRLNSLLQGNASVRSQTLQLLTDSLNLEITPNFDEATYGTDLISFLSGTGLCVTADGLTVSSNEAFQLNGLTSVKLLKDEVTAFSSHPFVAIGAGSLIAAASQNLLKSLDAVASLSCEAVGVNTSAFDAANFEVNRQHRGQMLSASNLRLLLEGSKGVNKELVSTEQALHFRGIPQITGPCQESIVIAAKAIDIELNSSEGSSADSSVYNASQVSMAIRNLVAALSVLAEASSERNAALNTILKTDTASKLGELSAAIGLNASYSFVQTLVKALSAEVFSALSIFSTTEAATAAAELASKVQDLSVADAEAKAAAGKANAKPEADDSKLTPAQLAAAEKKRKEKADKAAAKAAAKEAKKAGASIVLGAGATQIRTFFNATSKDASGVVTLAGVTAQLNPFNLNEESLFAQCVKVMEQLNSSGVKRKPKIPKGTRDYTPDQMRIREQAFLAIRRVFKRHGGVEIDTPVFELKEVLTGKYGEDSKLIYDLADQGGELLSLRYDLTVPFARFLAMNSVGNIKRFHIAKVYRRDQPQLARGRYREFYQCDFDIAGSYSPMVPDAEVISVAAEILSELPVGPFLIKLNHRKLLDAIFDICGVPMEKFRPICSAIDKLDKAPWSEVKAEMVDEKGLSEAVADKIGTFVLNTGKPKELWAELQEKATFGTHAEANVAMAELKTLFTYLEAMGSLEHVSFDLSLARGLDYYTGVIYEAVLTDGTSQVGSIAAGGRYDNLVGMFSPAGVQTPCVGVSIGIERVFTIMEKKAEQMKILQASSIQVYVASIGADLLAERMRIAQKLWKANVSAEYSHLDNPILKKQMNECLERAIPYMLIFGSEELAKGVVKLKNMREHTEVEVSIDSVVSSLVQAGCVPLTSASDLSFLESMKKCEVAVADA